MKPLEFYKQPSFLTRVAICLKLISLLVFTPPTIAKAVDTSVDQSAASSRVAVRIGVGFTTTNVNISLLTRGITRAELPKKIFINKEDGSNLVVNLIWFCTRRTAVCNAYTVVRKSIDDNYRHASIGVKDGIANYRAIAGAGTFDNSFEDNYVFIQ